MRNGFSKFWNKQFLIFLFFLGVSASFWLFQALNESYEQDYDVPIELRNIPENVVITTDLPKHARITLRDKGIQLLNYRYGIGVKPIIIDFKGNSNSTGHVQIRMTELIKEYSEKLASSTTITASKPDTLEFFYNYGLHKRVPVRLQGEFETDKLYYLSHCTLSTDSVTVYAAKSLLDTITAAYIQPTHHTNLSDTTSFEGKFVTIKGVKYEPSSVKVSLFVDRLVEKTIQTPIQWINFPPNKVLRTFPSKVNITFQVGMGLYRNITTSDFIVAVDYEKLIKNNSSTCQPELKTAPGEISHIRIHPKEVEYVIEDLSFNTNNH